MSHLTGTQKAIMDALKADAELMDIISGVYSTPDDEAEKPYIVIGDVLAVPWDADDRVGFVVSVELDFWSDYKGSYQVQDLQGRCHEILHRQALTVTGFNSVQCRYLRDDSFQDKDGESWRGIQEFELKISK